MKNLPEKIYLNFGDITKEEFEKDDYNEFCKLDEFAVTYCEDKVYDTDVEYVRKDAFIKKACEVFCKVRCKGNPPRSTCTSLGTCIEYDEFKNAMRL